MRFTCLGLLVLLTACPCTGCDPCSDDANLCANGGALEIDASCELVDNLDLDLGEGDGMFRTLAPGEAPEMVMGLQGGVHMVLGVGVDNPSADHLAFEVAVMLSAEVDGEVEPLGERTVVYDGALVEYDAGRAELLNLVVIPDFWPDEGRRWISLTVTDACGRMGNIDHAID